MKNGKDKEEYEKFHRNETKSVRAIRQDSQYCVLESINMN